MKRLQAFIVTICLILIIGIVVPVAYIVWNILDDRSNDGEADPTQTPVVGQELIDSDGDSLFDLWETSGLNIDDDDDLELDLATLGADPNRKDIFVEIDYMEGHAPTLEAVEKVVNAFAANEITLHIEVGDELEPEEEIDLDAGQSDGFTSFDKIKLGARDEPCDGFFGTAQDRAHPDCEDILHARKNVFRYGIFGDRLKPRGARKGGAGRAEVGGNDFIVTLGGLKRDDETGKFVYALDLGSGEELLVERTLFTIAEGQAGTLMHEIGHTLGLWHGGGDKANCKPNYLSVMSYPRQFPFLQEDWLNYSVQQLPPLDEDQLDEASGIGRIPNQRTVYGLDAKALSAETADWIDWNLNHGTDGEVDVNINHVESIGCNGSNHGSDDDQALYGFNDWTNLDFDFRDSGDFEDGIHESAQDVEEITVEEIVNFALELDVDGDGFAHLLDDCPFGPESNQPDRDGDGIGDTCGPVDDDPTTTEEPPTPTSPDVATADPGSAPEVDAGGPYEPIPEGSPVTLEGTATDQDGDELTLSWEVDPLGGVEGEDTTSSSPSFTLPDDGDYTFTLRATDPAGNTAEDTVTVTVTNVDPQFDTIPDQIQASAQLSQTVRFFDPGADTWEIEVDYGEGTPVGPLTYSPDPQSLVPGFYRFELDHLYAEGGSYDVQITMSDEDDGSSEASFNVTIDGPDLVILEPTLLEADPLTLLVEVHNQGSGDAGPFSVEVGYTTCAQNGLPVPATAAIAVPKLNGDMSVIGRVELKPEICEADPRYSITVDSTDAVEEFDEMNNTVSGVLVVPPTPPTEEDSGVD